MTASPRPRALTPTQLRAAMLGRPVEGVEVVRQTYRVTDDDSEELVLLNARGQWWVARRASDLVTLWAFVGGAHDFEWHQATA